MSIAKLHKMTGKKVDDISHLENQLMEDFDKISNLYDKTFKFTGKIERKSFINTQYVLFQLLRHHRYPCKKEDFNMSVIKFELKQEHLDLLKNLRWSLNNGKFLVSTEDVENDTAPFGADDVYEAIDLIEVSVHSLEKNRPQNSTKSKLPSIPFEAELRRWRYLGVSQSAGSYRAFFHNGKTTLMVEMGGLLLGEWRLSNSDKEAATATHPLGKSLILKVAISE